MPRLDHPRITKGDAVHALMAVYREDSAFLNDLHALRQPYEGLLTRMAVDMMGFWTRSDVCPTQYYHDVVRYYNNGATDPLPSEFTYKVELQPYFDALGALAWKWKIRAPWAVLVLSQYDIFDLLKSKGFPEEVDIQLEQYENIYPWPVPLPPLEIKIPAWAAILMGKKKIEIEIARRLEQYEKQLKETGLEGYPSSIEKHARWWYEHYVGGKTYKQVAAKFPEALEETIKRGVWKFSKLIDMRLK